MKSKIIEKDLKKFVDINKLADSEGGKILKDACLKDIISLIETLSYTIKPLALEEYIYISAKIAEKLSTYRVLINARKNVHLTKQALAEALEEEDEE